MNRSRSHLMDHPEDRWYGANLRQLRSLRSWLDDEGYSAATANGLIGALAMKDFESMASDTRSRYRAALRLYGPPSNGSRQPQKGVARSADNRRYVN